jgi:hypothetical protein
MKLSMIKSSVLEFSELWIRIGVYNFGFECQSVSLSVKWISSEIFVSGFDFVKFFVFFLG